MPRDPKDISIHATERTQRRIGELDDQKDPIRLRVGSGPAGAEGPEGKEGKEGKEGPEGSIEGRKRGTVTGVKAEEEKTVTHELGTTPAVVLLTIFKAGKFSNLGAAVTEKGATTFKFRNWSLVEVDVMWEAIA